MFMQDERHFQDSSDTETRCQNIQTEKSYLQDNMIPLQGDQNIQTEKSYMHDALPPVQDKQVFTAEDECTICTQKDQMTLINEKQSTCHEKDSPCQEIEPPCQEKELCHVETSPCQVQKPPCQEEESQCHTSIHQEVECFHCEYNIPQRWDGIRYPTQYGAGVETVSRIRHFNPPMKAAFATSLPKIDKNNPPFRKSYICVCAPKCPEVASLLSYEHLACMCEAPPPTPQSANNLGRSISLPNVTDSCECNDTNFFSTHSVEGPCSSKVVISCTVEPTVEPTAEPKEHTTPCDPPSMESPKPVCSAPKFIMPSPYTPPMPVMSVNPPMPPREVVPKNPKICPCCKQSLPQYTCTPGAPCKLTLKMRSGGKSCTCGYNAVCSEDQPCVCETAYQSFISDTVDEKPCTCGAQSHTNYHSLDSEDDDYICTCGTNYKSEKSCASKVATKEIMSRVYSELKMSTCGGMSKGIGIDGKSCTCGAPSKTNYKSIYSEKADDKSCTCGKSFVKEKGKSSTCGVSSKTNQKSIYSDIVDDESCTCGTLAQKSFVKEKKKTSTCGVPSKTNPKSIYSDIPDDESCTCGTLAQKSFVKEKKKTSTCGVPSKTNQKSIYSDIVDDESCTCGTLAQKSFVKEKEKSSTCGVPSKTNQKGIYSDIPEDKSCTCGTSTQKSSGKEDKSCTCGVPSKTIQKSIYSDIADDKSCTCGTSTQKSSGKEDKSCTCGTVSEMKSVYSNKDDSCPCATPTEIILKGVPDTKSGTCKPASKVTLKKVCSDKQKDKVHTVSKTKYVSVYSNKDGSYPCRTVSKVTVKSASDIRKSGTCGPSTKVIYNSVRYEKTSCSSRQPSMANKKPSICSVTSGVSDIFKNCQGVETSFKDEKSTSIYESAEHSSTNCCIEKKATSDVVTSLHPEVKSFCICKENGTRQQSPYSIKKKSSCNANDRASSTKRRKQNSSAYNPRKSKTRKSMQCSTRTSSRSRSVMAEVTCLCTSADRAVLGATNRKGPPFARVLRSGLSITPVNPCLLSLTDERDPRASVIWKDDNFCDCLSVSTDSEVDLGMKSNVTVKKSTRSVGGTQQEKSPKSLVKTLLNCLPKPAIIYSKNDEKIVDDKPKDEPDGRVLVKQMLSRLKAPKIMESCLCESEVIVEMSCDCPQNDESDDGCKCEPQDGCECEQEDCLKSESQAGCECEQEDCLKAESQAGCECPTEETDPGCTCDASVSRSGRQSCLVESNKTEESCPCATLRSVGKDIFKSFTQEPISNRSIPCKAAVSQSTIRRSVVIDDRKSYITNAKSMVSYRSCSSCPLDRKIYSLRIDESDNPQVDCTCKSPEVCQRQPPFVCKSETLLVCKREPQDDCTCQLPVKCPSEPQLECDCTCNSQVDLKTQPENVSTNKNGCNCAKERIVNMLDLISDKCDTKTDRSVIFQQIIKELTDMLRDAEKSVDCPCSSVKDCMEAVQSGRSLAKEAKARKEASNQGLTKGYLDRMQKCLNDCFPSKKPSQGYEIVAFEFDPKLLAERAAAEADAKAAAEAACEAEAAALAAAQAKTSCECVEAEPEPEPPVKFECACGVQPIESAVFQDCECLEESKVGLLDSNQGCPACSEEPDNQVCLPIVEGCEKDFQDVCGPLTDRERQLCDYLICRMCQICQGQADQDECPGTSNKSDAEKEAHKSCLCCHCCAMECDNQCNTVKKVLDPIVCDPVQEMQYFVDSMICDLQAVDHVVNKNKLYPKTKPSKCMGAAPGDSFPVVITEVSSLGCRALYLRWELLDCAGVGGYEIYVDGHLTNRFYNYRHEATVISNVDVTQPHQIILRTQALGQEFPEENDSCCSNAMVNAHPELLVGATQPWKPSVYMYEP